MNSRRGVTLIMVAAVLAILAALATGFYSMAVMQVKSAVRYSDSVRAELMAQAGVHYAIAALRQQAYKKTEDPTDPFYMVDYLRGAKKGISFPDSPLLHNGVDDDGDGITDNLDEINVDRTQNLNYSRTLGNTAENNSDRFTLNVSDAASKINVNAGDNLAVILDNLCRVIGPPLVAANLDAIQPSRWAAEAFTGDPMIPMYATALNKNDTSANTDIYYTLTDESGKIMNNGTGRPMRGADGVAIYGDGYAIAGYRARHGAFKNVEDIKSALTYVERNGTATPDDPLEQLEVEVKFAAIRDHITVSSWVDTNTVCVGKFEWIQINTGSNKTIAIDRDKSWVVDDPVNDPLNLRGSLRGCYVSIMNGHGAGQLRRIRTNGIDWIEVETGFAVTPGPISSYMIVSNEEALLMNVNGKKATYSYPDNPPPAGTLTFPMTNPDGTLVHNPKMDYSLHPLCIHRAPVNVNTATDKVLVALFLGIDVQHGHPLALGTDADVDALRKKWKTGDIHNIQPYVLTPAGLKRIPGAPGGLNGDGTGKVTLNCSWGNGPNQIPLPPAGYDVAYLDNFGTLGTPNFLPGTTPGTMTEAHQLAYRIIMARQTDWLQPTLKYIDPMTGGPTATNTGLLRGPFKTYDDLYFRVIKPWDDVRFTNGWVEVLPKFPPDIPGEMDPQDIYHKAKLANMLMANFNSNTDILKFNPNIEWIDRWSKNFTEQEPVMVYTNDAPGTKPNPYYTSSYPPSAFNGVYFTDVAAASPITAYSQPIYTAVWDSAQGNWYGGGSGPPPLTSSQTSQMKNTLNTNLYTLGAYITRSYRYKSDEMIDKTDLNRSTTEFSFDSNGVYEIASTGQVTKSDSVLAERQFAALVKVYDVWRETTQEQFVMGTISKAYCPDLNPQRSIQDKRCTGQLARDASGLVERKGLVTLPEPLLPLKTRIVDGKGNPNPQNMEVVSALGGANNPLDAFGNPRQNPYDNAPPIQVPEVLANRILPARYDGQITLATNTSTYDPDPNSDADTFLASFDGDLDTATCQGNGREQAKWPSSPVPDGTGTYKYTGEGYKHRCVQCIGLLGLLNDQLIASDPGLPLVDGKSTFNSFADSPNIRWVYPRYGISSALMPLRLYEVGSSPESPSYWNNVTVRMGALRTDGAFLGGPGVSGNTSTLKYLFSQNKVNFLPDSVSGNCITMWAKTTWHHDDMRNHEFFNPGNEAASGICSAYFFQKMGQYRWCTQDNSTGLGHCGNRRDLNDLLALSAYQQDGSGFGTALFGGYAGVNVPNLAAEESPGFRVQPFRWSFLGYRANYNTQSTPNTGNNIGPHGHWASTDDWQNAYATAQDHHYIRPFIDSEMFPELQVNWWNTPSLGDRMRWCYTGCCPWGVAPFPQHCTVGDSGTIGSGGRYGVGQDVKWQWADPYGTIAPGANKSFGMNNLNYGNPSYNQSFNPKNYPNGTASLFWHYHQMPEDGTYAVIDELKISNRDRILNDSGSDWGTDRVSREMQISRYYLPPNPGTRQLPSAGGPPTFTSQTLLQSLKGSDKLKDTQNVAVVRVSWNVFTPRFMCEYMVPGTFTRTENISHYNNSGDPQMPIKIPFKGPFDYVQYNDPNALTATQIYKGNPLPSPYSVNRPPASYYDKYKVGFPPQSGRGVEVELLNSPPPGAPNPPVLAGKTFTDPAAFNSLGTPTTPVYCLASSLRYRVRFCYPVDPLVDPGGKNDVNGRPSVDPTKHYVLDTPVFDDISVTYMLPPQILTYREVTE